MRAVVCVPWRPGHPSREEAWRRVSGNGFAYEMFTGDSDPALPFNRAAARNAAVAAAGDADVYIFNDADHAQSRTQVRAAVGIALQFNKAVHPYTQLVIEDLDDGRQWNAEWHRGFTSGNIVVPRTLFEATGGWDERFDKWGHEDVAFAKMCVWFGGPLAYIDGPVLAYEHHREPDEQWKNVEPPPLFERYCNILSPKGARLMAQEVRDARS